jgi:hypothetical protein
LLPLRPSVIAVLAALINGEPLCVSALTYAVAVVAIVLIGQRMSVKRR